MTRSACLVAKIICSAFARRLTRWVQTGYVLADDVSRVMQPAGDTWDLVVRDAGTQR